MDITKFIAHFGIIELSIGTALGLGFKHAVDSITIDLIKPILQAMFNIRELRNFSYNIMGARIGVGDALLSLVNFLVLLAVIGTIMYFFLMPLLKQILDEKTQSAEKNVEQNKNMIQILKDIRDRNSIYF